MGTARVEDPLGKVVFFTKLAEAVPMESGVFCRSDGILLISIRIVQAKLQRLCRLIQLIRSKKALQMLTGVLFHLNSKLVHFFL